MADKLIIFMASDETILRFEKVSFEYGHNHPILEEADFSVRRGSKITVMGQNGAGKSTLFALIMGNVTADDGKVHIVSGATIATARQVIPRDEMDLTVRAFFEKCFSKKVYDIDPKIDAALEVVNLRVHTKVHDKIIRSFSGGQQARLLLASALIQNPDILLLDEPTNNLDKEGVAHLTEFLVNYDKTVIVISHDADFLNAFTNGVLYLDIFKRKVEQYVGDYFDVLEEIGVKIEKEKRKNAQMDKHIQEKKDKANFFANKGGRMRVLAKRMRESAAEAEGNKVEVRRDDKTIRPFKILVPENLAGEILAISSFTTMKNHKPVTRTAKVSLRKNQHLLLIGPNGIGKSTLLESLANGGAKGAKITDGVKVGYYRQDFSTLNFEDTVRESLMAVMEKKEEERMRGVAAGFLIGPDVIGTKIGKLSEGQKGLVAFARLVLERPALLILDEPTNHINFRHLPVIAQALDAYEGAMVLVSHAPEFVAQVRIDEVLDLAK